MKKSENLFVRNNIDLSESMDWDLFAPYALFKDEYIDKESDQEIILSYVNAVSILNDAIKQQNHSGFGVVAVVRTNTLTMPFMFLVRHTVELILKHIRKHCNLPPIPKHNLVILWKDLLPVLKNKNCGFDDEILDYITAFINEISFVDSDGTKTRYSHDTTGKIQNNTPIFINCANIHRFVQALSKFVNIDFEETKNESTN